MSLWRRSITADSLFPVVSVLHQESFFSVSAEEVAANQEAQNSIRHTMDHLCPPGGSVGM